MHTPGAHLRKSCTRPWKCVRRAQGAPLISDTEYSKYKRIGLAATHVEVQKQKFEI